MHPTVRNLVLFGQLDASSELLFGLMQVQPSPARKTVLDTFVKTLKSAGIWQKLDLLYVLAAHDAQAARLNWIAPSQFALAVAGSPVFTADQGYAGDGSNAMAATGYNPVTLSGGRQTQNSATIGIFTRTAASYNGSTSRIDLFTGVSRMARRNSSENDYSWRMNDGTSANTALGGASGANQVGHFSLRRTAADERSLWRSGSQLATNAQASTALGTGFNLFGTTSNFSDAQISVGYAGSAFDDTQMGTMNTAIASLKTGIGF